MRVFDHFADFLEQTYFFENLRVENVLAFFENGVENVIQLHEEEICSFEFGDFGKKCFDDFRIFESLVQLICVRVGKR